MGSGRVRSPAGPMSYSTPSQRYLVKVLGQQLGLSIARVEEELNDERTYSTIADFLRGDEKVAKLLFFYQSRDTITEDGELIEAPDSTMPQLYLTTGELEHRLALCFIEPHIN